VSELGFAKEQLCVSCPGYREKKLTVKTDREDVVIALKKTKQSEP
jgi:hypothetical protein